MYEGSSEVHSSMYNVPWLWHPFNPKQILSGFHLSDDNVIKSSFILIMELSLVVFTGWIVLYYGVDFEAGKVNDIVLFYIKSSNLTIFCMDIKQMFILQIFYFNPFNEADI